MKQTVTKDHFRFMFRQIRPDNFSYEGLGELFDYLEQIENDTGMEMELDVIAICCDFMEATPKEIAEYYNLNIANDGNEMNNVLDFLHDATIVVGTTEHSIIFQQC